MVKRRSSPVLFKNYILLFFVVFLNPSICLLSLNIFREKVTICGELHIHMIILGVRYIFNLFFVCVEHWKVM